MREQISPLRIRPETSGEWASWSPHEYHRAERYKFVRPGGWCRSVIDKLRA